MKKIILLLAVAVMTTVSVNAQVIVNSDGTHSTIHGRVIVNPDGTHSTVHGRGRVIANYDGTHSTVRDRVIVNQDGTHSTIHGRDGIIINSDGTHFAANSKLPIATMEHLTLTLNARLQPVHRGGIYEDPIAEALEKRGCGTVLGGGTALGEGGEVQYCDIELEINSSKESFEALLAVIEEIAVPKGSRFIREDGDDIPVGTLEGLALYINGTELPEEVYENSDINFVIEKINELLGEAGALHSYWEGAQETGLYFYGASFAEMKSIMEGFLTQYPLCQKCRVEKIA